MDRLTEEDLERLARRERRATPGPWQHLTEHGPTEASSDPLEGTWEIITPAGDPHSIVASELEVEDAELLVEVRNLLPALLAELRHRSDGSRSTAAG